MRVRALLCVSLLLCIAAAAQTEPPKPQITVIKAGKLVDPDKGTAAANQVIVVEDKKIKAIGGPETQIPAGARVIDLSNLVVLPGLMDAHTHMALRASKELSYYHESLFRTNAWRAIEAVANSREMLEAGFTTIRDVGNAGLYVDTDLRVAIEKDVVPGPTVIGAGRIVAPYGGQFQLQPERRDFAEPEYFFADTRDRMLMAVRENVHYGAKVIKIVVDDQKYLFSPEDIRFMIDEASRAGVKLIAHAWTERGAHNAAQAGVASIEHAYNISDADIALAKKNNVYLVVTPFPLAAGEFLGRKEAKKEHDKWIDVLKRSWKGGAPMAFGSDAIHNPPGETRGTVTLQFADMYTQAGIPAAAVLKMMTSNNARLFGIEKERGFLQPGMFADIIATPENPLEDLGALKKVSFVMKEGKVFRQ